MNGNHFAMAFALLLCNQIVQSDQGSVCKDESEKLDILPNNLTLGDRSPMDLMCHLLAASGLEENPPLHS